MSQMRVPYGGEKGALSFRRNEDGTWAGGLLELPLMLLKNLANSFDSDL